MKRNCDREWCSANDATVDAERAAPEASENDLSRCDMCAEPFGKRRARTRMPVPHRAASSCSSSSTRARDRRKPRAPALPTLKHRPASSTADDPMDPDAPGPHVRSSPTASPLQSDACSESQHSSSISKVVEQKMALLIPHLVLREAPGHKQQQKRQQTRLSSFIKRAKQHKDGRASPTLLRNSRSVTSDSSPSSRTSATPKDKRAGDQAESTPATSQLFWCRPVTCLCLHKGDKQWADRRLDAAFTEQIAFAETLPKLVSSSIASSQAGPYQFRHLPRVGETRL